MQARTALADEIPAFKEIVKYFKLADKTAYRLAAEGKLPGFKVGGSWRFERQDIEEWIAKVPENQKQELE